MTQPIEQTITAPKRKRVWIPVVIVLSSLLVVALVVGGVASIASVLAQRFGPAAPQQELVTGAAPNAFADAPLECTPACFDESSVEATVIANETLEPFGFNQHDYPWGTYDPTSAGAQYRATAADWAGGDNHPDQCVFIPGNAPAAIILDGTDEDSTDIVEWTGSHADEEVRNVIDQSVRLFADSASATHYLETLADQVADCDLVSGGDGYSAVVTPAPALTLDESCAAIGWVRTGDPGMRWRAYTFDMQRGNMVVRIRLLTDGSTTEDAFRGLVESYSTQLATVQPTAAP